MKADKHLEKCTEKCKYNTIETCAFSLRTRIGCFLDGNVREQAAVMFQNVREVNSVEIAKCIAKVKMKE